jgi:hypothetical protein
MELTVKGLARDGPPPCRPLSRSPAEPSKKLPALLVDRESNFTLAAERETNFTLGAAMAKPQGRIRYAPFSGST